VRSFLIVEGKGFFFLLNFPNFKNIIVLLPFFLFLTYFEFENYLSEEPLRPTSHKAKEKLQEKDY